MHPLERLRLKILDRTKYWSQSGGTETPVHGWLECKMMPNKLKTVLHSFLVNK